MKSIFSKAVITAVIAGLFTLNLQAATIHVSASDTGKMKMDKMDKKMKMKKKGKMSKMAKDTASKM
jgi:hypothetical protein